jgi:hypothetical protein
MRSRRILIDGLTCLAFCAAIVVGTLWFYFQTLDSWLPW